MWYKSSARSEDLQAVQDQTSPSFNCPQSRWVLFSFFILPRRTRDLLGFVYFLFLEQRLRPFVYCALLSIAVRLQMKPDYTCDGGKLQPIEPFWLAPQLAMHPIPGFLQHKHFSDYCFDCFPVFAQFIFFLFRSKYIFFMSSKEICQIWRRDVSSSFMSVDLICQRYHPVCFKLMRLSF